MKNTNFVLVGLAFVGLSACSTTQEQFDFSKKAPDEFAVITRAPLEMPPNYTLRPPRPGVQRPQEQTTDNSAAQTVLGTSMQSTKTVSSGEALILQKTGAANANNNIRDVVDMETTKITKENTSTVNKILGKAGKKIDAPASVVDAKKESERLQSNKEVGAPVTQGETPTIKE